ncbi:MAG: cell division protein FtsQ/DivIB [Agarilytica sp.]
MTRTRDRGVKKSKSLSKSDQRAKVRGATTTENKAPIKWGRYVVLTLGIFIGGFGLTKIQWQEIYAKTYSATNKPLASIKIEGEFRFVSRESLQQLISSRLDGSFVDLNLHEVKTAIEANPWIDSVLIERIWPDSLKLKIEEHTPIARWNKNGFINREGELVKVESNHVLADLPLLSGLEANTNELTKNYVFFSELLKRSGLRIDGLSVDSVLSWSIQLDQGFELVLGNDDIQSKIENFAFVYQQYLGNKKNQIDRVDMRYEKGLAVKWKQSSEYVAVGPGQ